MPDSITPAVVFLMGATTSGKTDLAIKISQHLNTRLINVDSALIYQGLDIGTAKPDKNTLAKYPHHLIDICTPEQTYSAYDFVRDAQVQIEKAFANQQVPILVGGTMFYFHALEHGLSDLPASTPASKAKFKQLLQEKGRQALHQILAKIDQNAADRIHKNDTQRIIRALEVFDLSGKTLSELQGNRGAGIRYPLKKIVLMPERSILHQRIEARFAAMMENGFLKEVQQLHKNPNLHADLPAMRCVGYRQAWQYLNGTIDKQTMIDTAIIATRQLCKRQSTWLKSESDALLLAELDILKALDFIRQTPYK